MLKGNERDDATLWWHHGGGAEDNLLHMKASGQGGESKWNYHNLGWEEAG